MAIKQVLSTPRSPWQRAYVERVIGTIRREYLDHMIVFNDRSLYRHLPDFLEYYHRNRTHLAVEKDTPEPRPIQPPESGRIVSLSVLRGLHHHHERRAQRKSASFDPARLGTSVRKAAIVDRGTAGVKQITPAAGPSLEPLKGRYRTQPPKSPPDYPPRATPTGAWTRGHVGADQLLQVAHATLMAKQFIQNLCPPGQFRPHLGIDHPCQGAMLLPTCRTTK